MSVMSNQDLDFIDFIDFHMKSCGDVNDDAFQATIMEGVEAYNKMFDRDLDLYKGFLHYIESGS